MKTTVWIEVSFSIIKVQTPDARAYANSLPIPLTKGLFYGYKLHLVADGPPDLPLAWEVTPGNFYDGHQLPHLLRKAICISRKRPTITIADKDYDAGYNYVRIVEEWNSIPLIAIRGRNRARSGCQTTLEEFGFGRGGKRRRRRPRRRRS